jgi:hypothetical protein
LENLFPDARGPDTRANEPWSDSVQEPTHKNKVEPANALAGGPGSHARRLPFSSTQLLISLVLVLIASPLFAHPGYGESIGGLFLTLVLLSAVLAVRGRRRTLVIVIALVAPALAGSWLNLIHPHLVPRSVIASLVMLCVGFVMLQLLGYVVHARRVTNEVLSAAVCTYLLLGIFWAFSYVLVDQLTPGSFTLSESSGLVPPIAGFNAFYFSFGTLTTVTFGDIVPKSSVARMLAMAEAVSGIFYMAILISRLVSRHSERVARGEAADRDSAGSHPP